MKIARIATILLAGSLAFGLTACGEKQDSEKPAAAVQTVKEVKADLTIGDADAPGAIKIQLKNDTGYEIKALAVRPSGGGDFAELSFSGASTFAADKIADVYVDKEIALPEAAAPSESGTESDANADGAAGASAEQDAQSKQLADFKLTFGDDSAYELSAVSLTGYAANARVSIEYSSADGVAYLAGKDAKGAVFSTLENQKAVNAAAEQAAAEQAAAEQAAAEQAAAEQAAAEQAAAEQARQQQPAPAPAPVSGGSSGGTVQQQEDQCVDDPVMRE